MSPTLSPDSLTAKSWILTLRKTIFVLSCMMLSYFIAVVSTILYYFFYTILTNSPQKYPGMTTWQPFWILAIVTGFLISLFKSIIDITEEKKNETK